MRYKLYPKDYDPVIATGPPSQSYLNLNITWTPEETEYQKELEKQAIIIERKPPIKRWYLLLD